MPPRKTALKKTEAKVFRDQLAHMRARLRGDVNALADAALGKSRSEAGGDLSSMPIHMADIGSDNYEQEFTLNMMQSEESTLEMIEAALERVEEGTFGLCTECGNRIGKPRLEAIPYTPYCITCALAMENNGSRPTSSWD